MGKSVLILCTGNSARSQMAEGLLRHFTNGKWSIESAGSKPSKVRDEAIEAMREIGIDISGHRSKHYNEFAGREFDVVMTVCDNAAASCPVFPGDGQRVHWSFDDPHTLDDFRRVRDAIAFALHEYLQDQSVQ